jgi:starvation-inducible DNA-binding protein
MPAEVSDMHATLDRKARPGHEADPGGTMNDLPLSVREAMTRLLNKDLADAVDLQSQCKHAHWNVKGPQFYGLHKLFDEIHASVSLYVDALAERAVQLGGVAMGTLRSAASASRLPEYPSSATGGSDHTRALSVALSSFGKAIRESVGDAEEAGDAVTSDVLIAISRGTDRWLWFVEAHLRAG